jgi:hypothetical protein
MGGLLAADSLREFVNTRPDKTAPLWPKIIACFAFDTPVRKTLLHMPLLHGSMPSFAVSGYPSLRCQKHNDQIR